MKTQLKLMLNRKTFKVMFTIMMLIVMANYISWTIYYKEQDITRMLSVEWLYTMTDTSSYINLLITLFPFISIISYGFSAFYDKTTHTDVLIRIRSNDKRYLWEQLLTCFISGFVVVVIPFLIGIFLNYITFSSTGNKNADFFGYNEYADMVIGRVNDGVIKTNDGIILFNIYLNKPLLYNMILTLLAGVFSGVCSIFNYSVSLFVKKNKILILLPTYIFLYIMNYAETILMSFTDISIQTTLIDYIVMEFGTGRTFKLFWGAMIMMTVVAVILVSVVNRREIINNE